MKLPIPGTAEMRQMTWRQRIIVIFGLPKLIVPLVIAFPMFSAVGWAFLLHSEQDRIGSAIFAFAGPLFFVLVVRWLWRWADRVHPLYRGFVRRAVVITSMVGIAGAIWVYFFISNDITSSI
ncbi:MAG: hypothetical protein NUV56_04685 [Candidatus Uhrbacteria bacterium]|nr:hypothetical protein [Candidatus Uhrbacteria bacterium]